MIVSRHDLLSQLQLRGGRVANLLAFATRPSRKQARHGVYRVSRVSWPKAVGVVQQMEFFVMFRDLDILKQTLPFRLLLRYPQNGIWKSPPISGCRLGLVPRYEIRMRSNLP